MDWPVSSQWKYISGWQHKQGLWLSGCDAMVSEVASYTAREQCSQSGISFKWVERSTYSSWEPFSLVIFFILLNRGKSITKSLPSFKKKILILCSTYLPSWSSSFRAVTLGVRPGLTARCSLGRVVGEYTQLSPSRAQPSSTFPFCSGWGLDLIQEFWAQGSGPSVQTGNCCVPAPCSFSPDGGSWLEAKQGSVYISDGRVLPGSLLLWRTCCAQREEQRKELWVSFLPSLPTRQLGWLEDTCCAQGVCGWRLYLWGPGVGDAAGCRISYGLGSELPHGYNEPLISTDLIKGLLLTGGWGAPWASGRGCWAAQDSSLGMDGHTEEGQTRIHWSVLSRGRCHIVTCWEPRCFSLKGLGSFIDKGVLHKYPIRHVLIC